MNIEVDACAEHGVFLDRGDLRQMIGPATIEAINDITQGSSLRGGACPHCRSSMRQTQLNDVPVQGCTQCGGLWFRLPDLQNHVLGVRRRAYGEGSMAARLDVMRDATAFYPPETVAGILTDFDLEHEV
jgi:Zn-finger nucleic acid-binding protein